MFCTERTLTLIIIGYINITTNYKTYFNKWYNNCSENKTKIKYKLKKMTWNQNIV